MPDQAPQTHPDHLLLRRVVTSRDAEAFAQLYGRYQGEAFGFASSLLRDTQQAEDSVQEAMLDLWNARKAEFEGQTLRPIILKMVYQRCLNRLRQNRTQFRVRATLAAQGEAPEDPGGGAPTDHDGQIQALRRAVHGLPEDDRVLVTLYFGLQLSQTEIGAVLHRPQRTVSARLQKVLQDLRSQLAQWAPAALLGGELERVLRAACAIKTREAPPWVLPLPDRAPQSATAPEALLSHRLGAPGLVAAAALLAVLAACWSIRLVEPPGVPLGSGPASTVLEHGPAAPADGFDRVWHFDAEGEIAGLRLAQGRWAFEPATGYAGSGSRRLAELEETILEADVPLPGRPMEVGFLANPGGLEEVSRFARIYRQGQQVKVAVDFCGRTLARSQPWIRYSIILDAAAADYWVDGRRLYLHALEGRDGGSVRIHLRGFERLDELRIRTVAPGGSPSSATILAAVEKAGLSAEHPIAALGGLASLDPARPVVARLEEGRGYAGAQGRRWSFRDPPGAGHFLVSRGSWRHIRSPQAPQGGFMRTAEGGFAAAVNLVPEHAGSLVVSVRLRWTAGAGSSPAGGPAVIWEDLSRCRSMVFRPPAVAPGWRTVHVYLLPALAEIREDGVRTRVLLWERANAFFPKLVLEGAAELDALEVRLPNAGERGYLGTLQYLVAELARKGISPAQFQERMARLSPQDEEQGGGRP